MKAVNLLPDAERPRAVVQAPPNASVAVLAVLGALLLGVAGWVVTKNQVNDRHGAIAQANQEKAAADQKAQGLKAFGDFSQIKQTRVQSVTDLATKRFDWERFMRELALVLPNKVWVSDVSAGGAADEASSGQTATTTPGQTATAGAGGRSVAIKGCAPSQKSVAETMVRLRTLHGAQEVDLQDSGKEDAPGASTSGDGSSSGEEGCGRHYQFNASVTFSQPVPADKGKSVRAPSRLGGGA